MEVVENVDLVPDLRDDEINAKLDELRELYGTRLKEILLTIKMELEHFAWFCSVPHNMENGEYAIIVSRESSHIERGGTVDNQDIEVYAHIMDSRSWCEIRGGVSFNISATSYAGDLLGGYVPFSYVESKWVSVLDAYKIETRMKAIEAVNPYNMVLLLRKWQKGKMR